MATVTKLIAVILEVVVAFSALGASELALRTIDWSFKESIEAAVLALGGWWGFIRSVVRPPVLVELQPAQSLQKSNPVRGIEPVVVNVSRMSRRVNVRITGLAVERRIDNLPLGPGQRFPLPGIVRVDDFHKERAEVAVTWTDWRNCKGLKWLTTRSVTLVPKNFGDYKLPLSVNQSGPSEQLKDIATALERVAENRTSLAEQQGVQEGVTVRLAAPVSGVLRDRLLDSKGFCRVVQATSENAFHDDTGQGAPAKQIAPTGRARGDLWLQFLSDDDLERMCRERHKASEDAAEIDPNRIEDDPGDRHG